MFNLIRGFILSLAIAVSPAWAGSMSLLGAGSPGTATVVYTGPGDIVSGSIGWFGLRAFSTADRGNRLIQLCNIADATCTDTVSDATTGKLPANPVIGSQTCGYAISSGTYNSGTGAVSLTLAASAPLASGNFLGVAALTGTGTSLSSLNGDYSATTGTTGTTVNYTAATGLGSTTITGGAIGICTGKIIYDRSAALSCGGSACDLTVATITSRGVLVPNCINSNPCLVLGGNSLYQSSQTMSSLSATSLSISAVAQRYSGFTTASMILQTGGANTNNTISLSFRQVANTNQMFAGTAGQLISNISDQSWHAFQAAFNGASSFLMCGGSQGTSCSNGGTDNSISPGTTAAGAAGRFSLGLADGTTQQGFIYLAEAGAWNVTFSGTQRTNQNNNDISFWGSF